MAHLTETLSVVVSKNQTPAKEVYGMFFPSAFSLGGTFIAARRFLSMETFFPSNSGRDVLILLVEDESVSRKALGRLLAGEGYTTEAVESAEEAVAIMSVGQRPSVALVDLDLRG